MSEDVTLVEKAALSMTEPSRARLTRALLASLRPRDEGTAAWYGEAAKLVDSYLADVQGSGAPAEAPSSGVAGEPYDERLDDDPTLAEIKRRRREIESGAVSPFEDGIILGELKRRLGLGD
ncbi:MAG: hypothetical protein JO306_03980 [Gemmatimonadetes bacterium]|nr:hypothetical protein [Gemmatimonadota bacterium]